MVTGEVLTLTTTDSGMNTIDNITPAVLLGTVMPWLIWALLRWRAFAQVRVDQGDSRLFRLSSDWRITGLLFTLAGPSLILLQLWLLPLEAAEPADWWGALILSFLMGGLAPIGGFLLWRGVFTLTPRGYGGGLSGGCHADFSGEMCAPSISVQACRHCASMTE